MLLNPKESMSVVDKNQSCFILYLLYRVIRLCGENTTFIYLFYVLIFWDALGFYACAVYCWHLFNPIKLVSYIKAPCMSLRAGEKMNQNIAKLIA